MYDCINLPAHLLLAIRADYSRRKRPYSLALGKTRQSRKHLYLALQELPW
jgi:hypothetical protein